jgi:hypothetical protein
VIENDANGSARAACTAAAIRAAATVGRVERRRLVSAVILDRCADDSGRAGAADRLGDVVGRVAEAVLEIGRNRQVGRRGDRLRVGERLVARELAILPAEDAGSGAARRRQRGEAEVREQHGRAGIEGVGDHEGAGAVVQRAKAGGLVGRGGSHTQDRSRFTVERVTAMARRRRCAASDFPSPGRAPRSSAATAFAPDPSARRSCRSRS